MFRNSLLETGAISEVKVTATGLEATIIRCLFMNSVVVGSALVAVSQTSREFLNFCYQIYLDYQLLVLSNKIEVLRVLFA